MFGHVSAVIILFVADYLGLNALSPHVEELPM